MIMRIKNNTQEIKTFVGQEIQAGQYYDIPEDQELRWSNDSLLLIAIANGEALVGDITRYLTDVNEAIVFLKNDLPSEVNSTSELILSWSIMKQFYSSISLACYLNYIDLGGFYFIWLTFRDQKFFIPKLIKNSSDCNDFESNYKSKSNILEAMKTRISNCKIGRKLHDRYVTFTTSDQDNFDNTDWKDNDFGDITYTMKDISKNTTLVNDDAKETWIDWEPNFSYEVEGGAVFVPSLLDGNNDDAWEIHVIGAPDVPSQYGGNINFISNPRIKWVKNGWLRVDSSLNPADVKLDPVYHSHKIRFVIKHPVGAKTEFQINLKVYK